VSYDRTNNLYKGLQTDALSQAFFINGAEKMRIDSTGNVGIGTLTPTYSLDVRKDQAGTTRLLVENTGTVGATTVSAVGL
jgi:hypothetical protein